MADVGSFLNILQCYITTVLHVLFALYHKLFAFPVFPTDYLFGFMFRLVFIISGSRAYIKRIITKIQYILCWKTQTFFSVHNTPEKF